MAKKNHQKDQTTFTENSVKKGELLSKSEFLKRHKISEKTFEYSECKWTDLVKIHNDYVKNKELLENVAQTILNKFLTTDAKDAGVHSVRFRLKKPESLIEKIIRKKVEARKKGTKRTITLSNYTEEINDLIGIRILHVFKEDWFSIHNFMLGHCCYVTKGNPIAFHRNGDEKDYLDACRSNGCEVRVHPKGYRSIHYIIDPHPKKKIGYAEIQVRTVFEDGWSEIDHRLRYSSKKGTKHPLDKYLLTLNRIAGSADEIGSLIKNRQVELRQEIYEKQMKDNKR